MLGDFGERDFKIGVGGKELDDAVQVFVRLVDGEDDFDIGITKELISGFGRDFGLFKLIEKFVVRAVIELVN